LPCRRCIIANRNICLLQDIVPGLSSLKGTGVSLGSQFSQSLAQLSTIPSGAGGEASGQPPGSPLTKSKKSGKGKKGFSSSQPDVLATEPLEIDAKGLHSPIALTPAKKKKKKGVTTEEDDGTESAEPSPAAEGKKKKKKKKEEDATEGKNMPDDEKESPAAESKTKKKKKKKTDAMDGDKERGSEVEISAADGTVRKKGSKKVCCILALHPLSATL
jgi:hypothetical protein